MTTVSSQLDQIDALIKDAMRAVEEDGGASPVLHAVVKEFSRKSNKAIEGALTPDEPEVWTCVVELEQAGDSAKRAAEADPGIDAATRKQVFDAHDAICRLKTALADQLRAQKE
jgi:hypothetical protein